jgi:hypothetical protein
MPLSEAFTARLSHAAPACLKFERRQRIRSQALQCAILDEESAKGEPQEKERSSRKGGHLLGCNDGTAADNDQPLAHSGARNEINKRFGSAPVLER